jgi:DNA segregation ATPase FtsK/SpoIIIE, S-DNA-T family
LRSKAGRRALVTLAGAAATHGLAWQATRLPLYLGKILLYAPNGLRLALWRPIRWASAEEGNWHLRQHAASRQDADTWLRLNADRRRDSSGRWWVVGLSAAATIGAGAGVELAGPAWLQLATEGGALLGLARLGRPAEKPIIEHAFNPARYVKLTAELTRAALVASGAGIKEPGSVKFLEEIHRDGPGYTALVELPVNPTVVATDVIDKRDYLAAGFRLPMAQVWPDPVPTAHPGVLAIWVADRPVDRMTKPESPLLTSGQLDWWGPLPYGHDVRMRPVSWRLDERNSLFGGMPGSGKTLAARNIALAAALDPIVQFAISELKGSGDFDALEKLCGENLYVSGADDRSKERTLEILRWLDAECERRGPAIRRWAAKGLNSQNKLNRAIAEADPSLRPILAIFDEIQELMTDPERGKEAARLTTTIVKRGRSLGIHLIIGSQNITDKAVPASVSSNVSNRLCLAVPSHKEVELILGTGYYGKGYRPTAFIPPAYGDNPWAGWGYLVGLPTPVQASYIDNAAAEAIVERAMALRRGAVPTGMGARVDRDVLADVIRVFSYVGRPGLHWQALAELLAERRPELYAGITAEAVSAQVRAEGVESVNVTVDGTTLKGCRREAIEQAIQRRALTGSGSGTSVSLSGS